MLTLNTKKFLARIASIFLLWGALITLLLHSQCAPPTSPNQLSYQPPDTFSSTGTVEMADRWWTVFEDERLNLLIDSALANNFNIQIAWERLQAARAVVDRQNAALYPDIAASVQSGISFPEPDFVGGENVRLGISADYEVDLWGRISSQVEAERFRAAATEEDYQAAVLSLSAEIVRSWFLLAEAQNQLDVVNAQIQNNENIINSLRNRFSSGLIRSVDILRQKQLLQNSLGQKQTLLRSIATLEHQLAVLTGQSPQIMDVATVALPDSLPPLPQTGVPSELIQRRPDVRASFRILQAADRDLATAISNKYPRLSLNASSSLRANNFDRLWESWAYSFSANIFAPLFNWGRLNAEVDRVEAIKMQRLYAYGQDVLLAFQEVEDALVQEETQREQIAILEEQLTLAEQTYEQLRLSYFNGSSDFLDVLTALDQVQSLQMELISAKRWLLEYRVSLYRALAGGVFASGD